LYAEEVKAPFDRDTFENVFSMGCIKRISTQTETTGRHTPKKIKRTF
jgi:hypothetical protein